MALATLSSVTSSTQSDDEQEPSSPPDAASSEGRKKKRKKKRKRKAEVARVPVAAPADGRAESASFGRALAFFVIAVGAALFYVLAAPADGNRPFALVTVGVAAFLCGASPGIDPQRSVAVFGAVVTVGLAIVGIRASEIGTVLAMGGGLGLGGGIHRLGRLGPDEGEPLSPPAGKALRRAAGS